MLIIDPRLTDEPKLVMLPMLASDLERCLENVVLSDVGMDKRDEDTDKEDVEAESGDGKFDVESDATRPSSAIDPLGDDGFDELEVELLPERASFFSWNQSLTLARLSNELRRKRLKLDCPDSLPAVDGGANDTLLRDFNASACSTLMETVLLLLDEALLALGEPALDEELEEKCVRMEGSDRLFFKRFLPW